MKTIGEMHGWMLNYQTNEGRPPTMAEIVSAFPTLGHRSSVRDVLVRLRTAGKVEEIRPEGRARRWRAVE